MRTNKKREALKKALGPGATIYKDNQRIAWLTDLDGRRPTKVQVDGEHDGSYALSHVKTKGRARAAKSSSK